MEWIIPCDLNRYDARGAFEKLNIVDWRQNSRFNIDDIVYIYASVPYQKIMFKTRVVANNLAYEERINDLEFWRDLEDEADAKKRKYVRLKLIKMIDSELLSLNHLIEYGLKQAPQGPVKCIGDKLQLGEYITSCFVGSNSISIDTSAQQIDEELITEGEILDKKIIISQFTKDLLHEKGFLLDHSDNTRIRFSTERLDSVVGFLGEGWSKQIKRLLLFEIENRRNKYTLKLIIGPGNQAIREALYNKAKENIQLYNTAENSFTDIYTGIYRKKFLTKEQLTNFSIEEIKKYIEANLEEFIKCDLNPLCDGLRSKQQIDLETQLLDIIHNDMFDEIEETEKLTYIKARIGHSKLREVLIKKDGCCKICGLSDERFLIASHIKPWSKSNNQERLDLNNVLLLCPHHDAAFDKGYITFDESGIIRISSELSIETRLLLNLNSEKKIELTEKQKEYIRWHEESIFHN